MSSLIETIATRQRAFSGQRRDSCVSCERSGRGVDRFAQANHCHQVP